MITPPIPAGPVAFEFKAARQPMLWAAGAYSSGILAGVHAWRPPLWWLVALTVFMAAAGYFVLRRSGVSWLLALGTFFLAGAVHIQMRSASPRLDTSVLPYADHREVLITAHVTAESRMQRGTNGELRQTFDLECEQLQESDGRGVPVRSGIRLSIYSPVADEYAPEDFPTAASLTQTFHYGDRIRFSTKLKPPRNFRNPGAFDYEEYLADRGIAALGSAKVEEVEHLPGFTGTRLEHWRNRLHRSVIGKVYELWPARHVALIDAMIIGEEAFIERDTRADFQRSGTYHILVVSGMNVSILAFVVFWTLRRLRVERRFDSRSESERENSSGRFWRPDRRRRFATRLWRRRGLTLFVDARYHSS